jgi:glycosyltransferase involved in cell wall biosynthesis
VSVELSVVIPVYDEADAVAVTVRSLTVELESSGFERVEIVVADDGSTDGSGDSASAAATSVPVRVERLPQNAGRFAARRAGLEAAAGDHVLFVDAGVTVAPGGLGFVAEQVRAGKEVWNAHTIMVTDGNPYGRFWSVVSALAFGDYVRSPRTTSFDLSNFDRFPKGTTCFLAPREALRQAFGAFRSRYADTRSANDDTPIIRRLAARGPIHISPSFACVYVPRESLRSFVRHAAHRGVVFLDGHGRRESRFFPVVVAFYPASLAAVALVARRPAAAFLLGAAAAGAAAVAASRAERPRQEVVSFAALTPVYLAAHGAGMWKGLALALANRLGGRG